jgi:hypothetical protein
MTSTTEESNEQFRYHIYIGDELVCMSKSGLGVRGFLHEFTHDAEYRGLRVTVRDTFLAGRPVTTEREGGSEAPSASIIPFPK